MLIMKINVGGTEFEIPDELIDCGNFTETVTRLAPDSICVRDKEIIVRKNWKAGDLDTIGRALDAYEVVNDLARQNRCRKLRTVGTRLAEMYLNKELWLEAEWSFSMIRADEEFLQNVRNRSPEEITEDDIMWKEIGKSFDIDTDDD